MVVTWLVLLGLALYALTIPYFDRPHAGPATYAQS
jgi:hypothetical protein